jgi:hypothetical protein
MLCATGMVSKYLENQILEGFRGGKISQNISVLDDHIVDFVLLVGERDFVEVAELRKLAKNQRKPRENPIKRGKSWPKSGNGPRFAGGRRKGFSACAWPMSPPTRPDRQRRPLDVA